MRNSQTCTGTAKKCSRLKMNHCAHHFVELQFNFEVPTIQKPSHWRCKRSSCPIQGTLDAKHGSHELLVACRELEIARSARRSDLEKIALCVCVCFSFLLLSSLFLYSLVLARLQTSLCTPRSSPGCASGHVRPSACVCVGASGCGSPSDCVFARSRRLVLARTSNSGACAHVRNAHEQVLGAVVAHQVHEPHPDHGAEQTNLHIIGNRSYVSLTYCTSAEALAMVIPKRCGTQFATGPSTCGTPNDKAHSGR